MHLIEFLRITEQEEVLYHGTDTPNLEQYDLSKVRTANHIYTTPDPEAAKGYGEHLYRAIPKAGLRYFSMSPEDIGPDEYKVLEQVYADLRDDYFSISETTYEDFIELVTSSKIYDWDTKGRLQDDIMNEIHHHGYDVVIFADARVGGGWAESFVFFEPTHLRFVPVNQQINDAEGNMHDDAWRADYNVWGTHGMGKNGFSGPFSISPDTPGVLLPGEADPTGGDGIPDRMSVVRKR